MNDKKPTTFQLKEEHIELVRRLNLKIYEEGTYGHGFAPEIDPKRPFGNSYMLGDVFEIMKIRPDADGKYSEDDTLAAYLLLAQLPAAYQAMMHHKTFHPGTYELPFRAGLYSAEITRNYLLLKPALDRIAKDEALAKYLPQIDAMSRSFSGDSPYYDMDRALRSYIFDDAATAFKDAIRKAIAIFQEEWAAMCRTEAGQAIVPAEDKANTRIEYLYRDADNYKCHNAVVIPGTMSREQIVRLMACLDEGEYFIPEQVGLPANDMQSLGYSYDEQSDHPWFQLYASGIVPTAQAPTEDVDPEALVVRFEKAAKDGWDESLGDRRPCGGAEG